ncbi:caspase family protein [Reichenbachiella sp.]
MKRTVSVFVFIGLLSLQSLAQSGFKHGVKIKPGNALCAFPDNKYVAIASAKDVVIVNFTTGVISRTLEGHSSNVTDLDINDDGTLLLSTSEDKRLMVWDVAAGIKKSELQGHSKSVIKGEFIDSKRSASIGEDGTMKVWSLESGSEIQSFSDHGKDLESMAIGKHFIASGDKKGEIVLRNKRDYELVKKMSLGTSLNALAFDLLGTKLITGTDDGLIKFWNAETGELLAEINNGKGNINNITMAFDNQHIIVSGQTCKIYSLKSMELAKEISQVSSKVLDAAVSPDGQNLIFIEEFASKARFWDVSDVDISYAVRLKDDDDKTPPQIYLSSPAKIIDHRVVHYQDMISVSGSVIDDSGVRSLKINGINTPVKQNGNYVIRLPLAMGDNFVTMEVVDVNDNTAIKKFIVSRKNMDGEEYDPSEAKNYLLVVGINKYQHWPQLYNAVKDANDVVSTLMSLYNFEFSNVKLITDEMATRANIYKVLREYVNLVGPKDNFMIYYSGHGHFDELLNEGYWVPVDARLNSNGDYLSNSDISKIIGSVNSQHTFLVADACYSGSLFNEQSRGYAENVEKFKSRWGLASGRLETVSDGALGKNSPFARNFINYLKTNEKDKVTVSEIVQYVKVQVSEVSDQTPIGNPLKGVGDEGGEFIFYRKEQ